MRSQATGTATDAGESWRRYLARFHGERAGITGTILTMARNGAANPYEWALQPFGPAPARLVDVACGDAPYWRTPRSGWTGVDVSRAELHRAKARGVPGLVQGDATSLPVASASVPALICCMALMLVQPLGGVLGEIRRVLTEDGTAVAVVPGRWPVHPSDFYRYAGLMALVRRTHLHYPNDVALIRLRSMSARAGLDVVDDRRQRFEFPLPDRSATEAFLSSLYLPGVGDRRLQRAAEWAEGWSPGSIGIPLRRVTFQPKRIGAGAGPRPMTQRRHGGNALVARGLHSS